MEAWLSFVVEEIQKECCLFEIEESQKKAIEEQFKFHEWKHDPRLDPEQVRAARATEVQRLTRYQAVTEISEEDYDGEAIPCRWVDDDSKDPTRSRIVCKTTMTARRKECSREHLTVSATRSGCTS